MREKIWEMVVVLGVRVGIQKGKVTRAEGVVGRIWDSVLEPGLEYGPRLG